MAVNPEEDRIALDHRPFGIGVTGLAFEQVDQQGCRSLVEAVGIGLLNLGQGGGDGLAKGFGQWGGERVHTDI